MTVRLVAAAAVLVSAGVHLKLWFDGFRHEHVVGPAFMLNAVAGVVIAVLLVAWKHWLAPLLAVGLGIATLGAFTISTTDRCDGHPTARLAGRLCDPSRRLHQGSKLRQRCE